MSESIEAKVQRYKRDHPILGKWCYSNAKDYTCKACAGTIKVGEIMVEHEDYNGGWVHSCEPCVLGIDKPSAPETPQPKPKEKPKRMPQGNWVIRPNGSCYFCGHGVCVHTERARLGQ